MTGLLAWAVASDRFSRRESGFRRQLGAQVGLVVEGARVLGSALTGGMDTEVAQERLDGLKLREEVAGTEITRRLAALFVAPLDRGAVSGLARGLGDLLESVAHTVDALAICTPPRVPADAIDQAELLIAACAILEGEVTQIGREDAHESALPMVREMARRAHAERRRLVRDLISGGSDVPDILIGREILDGLAGAIAKTVPVGRALDRLVGFPVRGVSW